MTSRRAAVRKAADNADNAVAASLLTRLTAARSNRSACPSVSQPPGP
jgi:hypothetical protein